jgi:hypothetical protein
MKAGHLLPFVMLGLVPPSTSYYGCEPIGVAGIRVTVLDSLSNQPLPAAGVTVVAIVRALADTALLISGRYEADAKRAGIYRVQVNAPGYVTWVQEGVRVESPGNCGNPGRRVDLTARMRRLE